MDNIFIDEFGYKLYFVRIVQTRYAIHHFEYANNRKYYSISKISGFVDAESAKISMWKIIDENYEYEYNSEGKQIYSKNKNTGDWFRKIYDFHGNWVGFKRSDGLFWEIKYTNGILTSYTDSDGNWWDKKYFTRDQLPFKTIKIGNYSSFEFPDEEVEGKQLVLDLTE